MSAKDWIGPRPSALQMAAIMSVGTIGILIPGVQPIVLASLMAEQRITLTQLGHAASIELLCMGSAAALAAALLPPRRLREISVCVGLLLALGNWYTPTARGEVVTVLRALTGVSGGMLIWVTACMIARSADPDRWAGIYLTVQTIAQFIVGAIMATWVQPAGGRGDFLVLATTGLFAAVAALWLPASFQSLPKRASGSAAVMPPARGVAGLTSSFLLLMCIVSIWVYYDPIAREAGLPARVSDQAVSVSLAFQVLGGAVATLAAGRLHWYPVFAVCAAVDFAMIAILGMQPSSLLFLADAAIFGFIWLFVLPFLIRMLIDVDPSRRSAVLWSGVCLLGASLAPTLAGLVISPSDTKGVLWFGAACLLGSFGIATVLRKSGL